MAASGNAARTASIRVMARRLGEGDGRRLFSDAPGDQQLRQWAVATGVEYQAWVFHHGYLSASEWRRQREAVLSRDETDLPVISVLTPTFNTRPEHLRECVHSVRTQSYPYWELILVDDASTDPGTLEELAAIERLAADDPRIRVRRLHENTGICAATNTGLEMASGDYVAFLDHDDRIAPDALYEMGTLLADEPRMDVVYSDRDFLTAEGYRTNPLLKPHWGPETLLSGNFMFHLMVYRRSIAFDEGGYRREYEGSQDLDLALRVAERPRIRIGHITKVLYHWRQHGDSMAGDVEAKPYVFDAGIAAVRSALERRGIAGTVEEVPDIWRGNYLVHPAPTTTSFEVLQLDEEAMGAGYAAAVRNAVAHTSAEILVVMPAAATPDDNEISSAIAWIDQPGIVAVTGRIVASDGTLRHGGLVRRPEGEPQVPFLGTPPDDPGHGAMSRIVRNVSLVHPHWCAWSVEALRPVLTGDFEGPAVMLDAAIRATENRQRLVYAPTMLMTADDEALLPAAWPASEYAALAVAHPGELEYDWHFHWAFDREHSDGRMGLGAPPYAVDPYLARPDAANG